MISLHLIRDTDGLSSAASPQQQHSLHAFNHLLLLRRQTQLRLPALLLEPLNISALKLPDFERTIGQGVEQDLISLDHHPSLCVLDMLVVWLPLSTRSATVEATQRVIDL